MARARRYHRESLSLGKHLLDQAEHIAKQFSERTMGTADVTRAAVIRQAVTIGLEQLASEIAKEKAAK